MKKLIAVIALSMTATSAFAHGWGHGGWHGGYGGYHGGYGYDGPRVINQYNGYGHGYYSSADILIPMVIGGIAGYAINEASRQPQIYQQPQVIYQQPQATVQTQRCTAWVESIDAYGVVTKTRTCY